MGNADKGTVVAYVSGNVPRGRRLERNPPSCGHYLFCFHLRLCLVHSDFTSQRDAGGFLTKALDEIDAQSFHQDLTRLPSLPPCRCLFPAFNTPNPVFVIPVAVLQLPFFLPRVPHS